MSILESVFDNRYSRLSKDVYRISIRPANRGKKNTVEHIIQFRRPQEYPAKLPVISVYTLLAAYIRLSIIK